MVHTVYSMQGWDGTTIVVVRAYFWRLDAILRTCVLLLLLGVSQVAAWGRGPGVHIVSGKAVAGTMPAGMPFSHLEILRNAGEVSSVGMAPFRTLEIYQRHRIEFRLWRKATDPKQHECLEQQFINDAGILGHYVIAGSEPLPPTINHRGWVGDNPKGYAREPDIHARFESPYVETHILLPAIASQISEQPHLITTERAQIVAHFRAAHEQVIPLYELDQKAAFNATTSAPKNTRFRLEYAFHPCIGKYAAICGGTRG